VYVPKYQEILVFKIVPSDRCSPNLEFATRACYFCENKVARMAMYSTFKLIRIETGLSEVWLKDIRCPL
jgi:hypothetical protein